MGQIVIRKILIANRGEIACRIIKAILISGLTTVCGFAVLFLSPMPLVRNFGIITAATIIYSVLIAIFVLPSLIWMSNRIKEWYYSQIRLGSD